MATYSNLTNTAVSVGRVPEEGLLSTLNITAATIVKASAGRIFRFSVVVAGSATGTVNDCATTAAAAASNQIATTPTTLGTTILNWPCTTGIVIVPGTGQTIAVTWG